jgi:RNA polymerase sigma factor (TIGR02999 family)
MTPGKDGEITGLLRAWKGGDASALDRLAPRVYQELHRMARRHMRNERGRSVLQTTVLVNEVYLRLVDAKNVGLEERAQFFALCAQMMRRILVDAARARGARKRGGGAMKVNVDDSPVLAPQPDAAILAMNDALEEFAKMAPRQARVVELRWFAGMSEVEVAEVLQTSDRTVRRDWEFACAWLKKELSRDNG